MPFFISEVGIFVYFVNFCGISFSVVVDRLGPLFTEVFIQFCVAFKIYSVPKSAVFLCILVF